MPLPRAQPFRQVLAGGGAGAARLEGAGEAAKELNMGRERGSRGWDPLFHAISLNIQISIRAMDILETIQVTITHANRNRFPLFFRAGIVDFL